MIIELKTFLDIAQYPTPSDVDGIITHGYYAFGDGGEGVYTRVAAQPAHNGYGLSATGNYFELTPRNPVRAKSFGVKADASIDSAGGSFIGITTLNSSTITTTSTVGVAIGRHIAGIGIPATAVVISFVPNVSITMDQNATAAATGVVVCWASYVTGTDDILAIQNAIDYAISKNLPDVLLPVGKIRTSDTIHVGYGETFHTINLKGGGERASFAGMPGTMLYPTATDRPAINIQGGRFSGVYNIGMMGQAHDYIAYALDFPAGSFHTNLSSDINDWLPPHLRALGTTPGGFQRYAPYAGITIDAYSGAAPSGGAAPYPGTYGRVSSSDTIIEKICIKGFGVGLCVQPSGADAQSDFVKFRDASLWRCGYGISISNTNARSTEVRNIEYVDTIHTILTNKAFGAQHGRFGGAIESISAIRIYQLLDINLSWSGPMTLRNVYMEIAVKIGSVVASGLLISNPVVFDGCEFNFSDTFHGEIPSAYLNIGVPIVTFNDCVLLAPTRIGVLASGSSAYSQVIVQGGSWPPSSVQAPGGSASKQAALNYTGGIFLGVPIAHTTGGHAASVKGLKCGYYSTPSSTYGESQVSDEVLNAQLTTDTRIPLNQAMKNYLDLNGRMWRMTLPQKVFITGTATYMSVLPAMAGDVLTFTYLASWQTASVDAHKISEGDLLFYQTTSTLFLVTAVGAVDGSGNYPITAMQQNNMKIDTTTFAFVSNLNPDTDLANVFVIIKTGYKLPKSLHFGTFTAGSPNIANVERGDGNGAAAQTYYFADDAFFSPAHNSGIGALSPIGVRTSINTVTNGTPGSMVLSANAVLSGRFPIFPFELR